MYSKPAIINVLAEFETYGIRYSWDSATHIRCLCPFHDDATPSCHVNVASGHFKCFVPGCDAGGDIITLLARYGKTSRVVVFADLQTRYEFDSPKIISPESIERYHIAIWKALPLLQQLYDRGVTDDIIRQRRWGENENRVTIPIPNEGGLWVNIRKYLPGAPGAMKMRSIRGHGEPRLYPVDQLKYNNILFCGGEVKAAVAAEELNKHNWGAICITAGEGKWLDKLTPKFAGKHIVNCLDIDDAGRAAADIMCRKFHGTAAFVGDLLLPLDRDKYPKGDINDYIGREGGKLFPLLAAVQRWQPALLVTAAQPLLLDSEPEQLELAGAICAEKTGKRVAFKACVTASHETSYIVPRTVKAVCDKSESVCSICPVSVLGVDTFELQPESSAILAIVNAPNNVQREELMRSFGIPTACNVMQFAPETYYTVDDVRVSPQLDITNRSRENIMQPAMVVNTNGKVAELNESYKMIARMYPHPRNQQSTLLVSDYVPTQDALASYECKDLHNLEMFQPAEWTINGIQSILDCIYADFEANVTRIFQRRDMHLVTDLAYHSPLYFSFDQRSNIKGWVEVLIVGDSAQGKSEVVCGSAGPGGLMKHYGLGHKAECKNASVAGLLGGLQKLDGRWFITWGVFPTHDKRLVILEELKGASTEVIGKLTDMRSSGIATIEKIQKRRAQSRVRLVALSNTRGDKPLANHNFGIDAIRELIGALEDIRRFDLCLLVSAKEVDAAKLNTLQRKRPTIKHTYTSELCRALILWGWTRTGEQVQFTDEATQLALDAATELSNKYTDNIPLIDRGSARYKIARLAASLAVRTFSCDTEMHHILVRACHVEYIVALIERVYGSPVAGYLDYTAAVRITQELVDPEQIKKAINDTPFAVDFCKQLLSAEKLDAADIQDFTGWERAESLQLLSKLVRKHALMRDGRSYVKTSQFIGLLKHLVDTPGELVNRPEFIKEQF